MTFDVEEVLSRLTVAQKDALLSGKDFWHTHPIPDLNLPSIRLSDGPNGICGTRWFKGTPTATLPCGTALAATWDKPLLRDAGELLGNECIAKGAHCWLGPTINIQRSPLNDRGAEAFSEDPYLTGVLARELILGCQSTGVVSTIKHFACNDQEDGKRGLDAQVSQRALREIYLRPFQIAARDADPGALMTSYNRVNGIPTSENKELLQGVLRDEWKWDPLIMSDSLEAGLDLEMPGPTKSRGFEIELYSSLNMLRPSVLDARVRRVLQFIMKASSVPVNPVESQRNLPEDRELNRNLSAAGIVLLQNKIQTLPILKRISKISLVGSHIHEAMASGMGSTAVEPYYTITPYQALMDKAPNGVEVRCEVGAYAHKFLPLLTDRLMKNAVIRFFNEPSTVASRVLIDKVPIDTSYFQLVDYTHEDLNSSLFYTSFQATFSPDETGEWTFGLAVYGTAILYIDDELLIDNSEDQTLGSTFFGCGTDEKFGKIQLVAGKDYELRVEFGSTSTMQILSPEVVNFGGGGARIGACRELPPDVLIERAVGIASQADYTIICTGLSGKWEGEGNDCNTLSLPPHVDDMMFRVAAACPNTVVVNISGGPVAMQWASKITAIIQACYGGGKGANGLMDVLFSDVNPSGKLPFSWLMDIKDTPAYLNFGSNDGRLFYGEDVYVGYRFYDRMERETMWSFGHGLSYTCFKLSSLRNIREEAVDSRVPSAAKVLVRNTGSVAGAEVVQLYISHPPTRRFCAKKELYGFDKVFLGAGEEKEVSIDIDPYAMSVWDEAHGQWRREKGEYTIIACTSSDSRCKVRVEGSVGIESTTWW